MPSPHNMVWTNTTLKRIERKLDLALTLLLQVRQGEGIIMSAIDDVLAQAEAAARANSEADDAAEALLVAISKMIADLKATGTDPATIARIQALADALNARAAQLAAAVVANTPAVEPPPVVEPPVEPTPA